MKQTVKDAPRWKLALCNWYHFKRYYPQLGLYSDDVIFESPTVKEAIRRLPKDVYDARNYRISRAATLSAGRSILPREEWVKFEDDDSYIADYLAQVKKEEKEKKMWSKRF